MAKVMNAVFGIGIAVILFIVVMLGVQVFYHEPSFEDFNCTYPAQVYTTMEICNDSLTVLQCREMVKNATLVYDKDQKVYEECNKRFQDAEKEYGKNLFVVNNIAGIIFVIVSLFILAMPNIAAGTAFSGLALIIYGFMRGWQGIGDKLKFVVALIVAALFVYFAVVVNKKYNKKR
jgi:hypothetical protein